MKRRQETSKPPLSVRRLPQRLVCDPTRTITRFFWPGSDERAQRIVDRVMSLPDADASAQLASTIEAFADRHEDLHGMLLDHCREVASRVSVPAEAGDERRVLIGAYFTMEYAFESAALSNPSMVPTADQSGLAPGSARFLMSLRAVGEGHVSSIVFRTGTIDPDGDVHIQPPGVRSHRGRRVPNREFDKERFLTKMIEVGLYDPAIDPVLEALAERFHVRELRQAIQSTPAAPEDATRVGRATDGLLWLAESNYEIRDPDTAIADLVLFPTGETESQGMEDMRLVRFVDDEGTVRYYGTYTAYNGHQILPQLLEIHGQGCGEIHILSGRYARDKGIALFPRMLDGWYAAIVRVDGENLYLARSKNIRFWNEGVRIREPRYAWEFVQIGNCGSPIETEAGWLLLTHGVGPMRRYCMGALLLDLDDPTRVIGQLEAPLLTPTAEERNGYVPNVIYSCGSMLHNQTLIIPYGISDAATGFATVRLDDLLARLRP